MASKRIFWARLTAALFVPAMLAAHAEALAQARPTHLQRAPTEQDDVRPSASQTRPLPEIVAGVQSTAPFNHMDYIGVAGFDMRAMVYVLRFLDGRQVVVVHVDARTGRIIGRTP